MPIWVHHAEARVVAPPLRGAGGLTRSLRALASSRWAHPAMGLGVVAIALLIGGGV
jgi:hypothetical protein